MPAIERAFSDPLPQQLYLDTNIILDYLVSTRPHHPRVESFILRLAQHGLTQIYISSLSWLEFIYVVMRQDFRNALPDTWQQDYGLNQWQTASVRSRYLTDWLSRCRGMLAQFEWTEVAVTPDVSEEAAHHVMAHNLKPQDAAHLACARAVGVTDLASLDESFRRVDGLYLWNDRIHARRPT